MKRRVIETNLPDRSSCRVLVHVHVEILGQVNLSCHMSDKVSKADDVLRLCFDDAKAFLDKVALND